MQKLSTIQINLLRAPRCLDHPGGCSLEVRQGQPEADSELALSPVFPQSGLCLWLHFYVSPAVWCACPCGVAAYRAEIVCHAFPPIWTGLKQSGKWKCCTGLSSGDRGGRDGTVHLELMKKCNAHMQHEGSCRITACHSHLEATFVTSKERGAGRRHYLLQTPPHQFLSISCLEATWDRKRNRCQMLLPQRVRVTSAGNEHSGSFKLHCFLIPFYNLNLSSGSYLDT